ncbi:MAG: hypothetical protein AB1428_15515 [Bacteroidota bacterium]
MYFTRKPKHYLLAAVAAALIGAVAAVAILLASPGSGKAAPVEVRRGNETVQVGTLAEALRKASELAGFEVRAPSHLPQGYSITAISIPPSNQFGPFMSVEAQVMGAGSGFTFEQTSTRFVVSATAQRLDSPNPRVELFRDEVDYGVVYTLLTPSRGYSLNMVKPFVLPQEDAVKVLSSLPAD